MGRSFGRLIFGIFLGLLLGRALRRRRWHAGKHYFDPDGPGWERPGWHHHRPHHHHG